MSATSAASRRSFALIRFTPIMMALTAPVLLVGCRDDGPKPKPPTPVVTRPAPTEVSAPAPTSDGASTSTAAAPHGAAPGAGASPRTGASRGAAPRGDVPTGRVSGASDDPSRVEIAGLVMPKPVTWAWQKPSMQFRTLQYAVPAPGGASPDAELIFSLFPAGDGGPIEPNIDRWANQFRTAEDAGATPTNRSTREIDGMRVTRVDLRGAYMGMGAAAPRPNMAQLGAIVESPDATVFIRLLGPEATVETARKEFEAMIDGLRRASAASAPAAPE